MSVQISDGNLSALSVSHLQPLQLTGLEQLQLNKKENCWCQAAVYKYDISSGTAADMKY